MERYLLTSAYVSKLLFGAKSNPIKRPKTNKYFKQKNP